MSSHEVSACLLASPAARASATLLSVGLLLLPGVAAGQARVRIEGDASVMVASNPLLTTDDRSDPVAVAEASVTPIVQLDFAPGGTAELRGTATDRHYGAGLGNFFLGNIEASGRWRRSERLTLRAEAEARRDLALDLLTTSSGATAEPTSIQTSYRGRLAADVNTDAYTAITGQFDVRSETYDRTTLLQNVREFAGTVQATRRVGPRTSIGALVLGSVYDIAGQSPLRTVTVQATWSRKLNVAWRLDVDLGLQQTGAVTASRNGVSSRDPSRTLFSGRGELCRQGQARTACFEVSYAAEGSSIGRVERRFAATATGNWRLQERTTLRFSAGYQRSSPFDPGMRALQSLEASGAIERRLMRNLSFAVRLAHASRDVLSRRTGSTMGGIEIHFTPGAP